MIRPAQRALPRITQHMLTMQLRELQADGLVTRTIYAEVPPRVVYAVTDHGRSLEQVLPCCMNGARPI